MVPVEIRSIDAFAPGGSGGHGILRPAHLGLASELARAPRDGGAHGDGGQPRA